MKKIAWPYVTLRVRGADGALVIREFYKDAPVPDGADKEDLARLVRKGAIVDEDVIVSDTPPFVEEKPEVVVKPTDGPVRPADTANKPLWVDYAVAMRADGVSEEDARAEAEATKKDDLIARFPAE